MKSIQPIIRNVCYDMLVKSFLNPESEVYVPKITGETWQRLIANEPDEILVLIQTAFDDARLRYEESVRPLAGAQTQGLSDDEKEYYAFLEAEAERIFRENDELVAKLKKRDADNGIYNEDAWYNQ